jgi:hypothetical protein
MKKTYELRETDEVEQLFMIDATGTEWAIPTDPDNSERIAYLAWLENPEAEETSIIERAN